MPILLYTYLGTEILAPFFASFLILNGILFLGRLVPFLDVIFNYNIGLADFIRLCSYILPNLMLFSIPMASMIGVIIAFTKLSNENEIMVLKAAGIGLYKMLPPVIIFALFSAALASLASTHLIPAGNIAMKRLLFQLAKEKIDKGLKEKQFSDGIRNVVLYIDQIDKKNNAWNGVYVSDLRDKKAPLTVIAKSGSLDAHVEEMYLILKLNDGTMHRTINDLSQTIQFKKYTLNLPMETPQKAGDRSASAVDKKELSLQELWQRAHKKENDSKESIALLIEFHKRLVLPAGCFILTLLGLPLALQSRPGQRTYGFPIGLSFFVLYYVCITAAKTISENNSLPVWLSMWLPNLLFSIVTVYFILKSAKETPNIFFALSIKTIRRLKRFFKIGHGDEA